MDAKVGFPQGVLPSGQPAGFNARTDPGALRLIRCKTYGMSISKKSAPCILGSGSAHAQWVLPRLLAALESGGWRQTIPAH